MSRAHSPVGAEAKGPVLWRALLLAGLILALAAMVWQAAQRPLVTDEIEFVQTGPSVWQGPKPLACDGPEPKVILHHPQGYHLALGTDLGSAQMDDHPAAVAGHLERVASFVEQGGHVRRRGSEFTGAVHRQGHADVGLSP